MSPTVGATRRPTRFSCVGASPFVQNGYTVCRLKADAPMDWRMPPETWDKRSERIRLERDAIVRRAEERHVESLVRELAALLDRNWRQEGGHEPIWEIREVQLRGEYPDAAIAILRHDRSRDFETWTSYPIWGDLWERPDGTRYPAERLAAEMLTWALGAD